MKKTCSLFTGLFAGALIGSALVLLLTPWSGDELKDKIKDYAENFQEEVRQAGAEKRQELEEQLARLRSGK
ncbi:MAG TPA: YtxH domain-containing protein [Anaerolineaceae bacterium]|nr:YtxH domain-containing protein [Anaerolineaceae bacterium]